MLRDDLFYCLFDSFIVRASLPNHNLTLRSCSLFLLMHHACCICMYGVVNCSLITSLFCSVLFWDIWEERKEM